MFNIFTLPFSHKAVLKATCNKGHSKRTLKSNQQQLKFHNTWHKWYRSWFFPFPRKKYFSVPNAQGTRAEYLVPPPWTDPLAGASWSKCSYSDPGTKSIWSVSPHWPLSPYIFTPCLLYECIDSRQLTALENNPSWICTVGNDFRFSFPVNCRIPSTILVTRPLPMCTDFSLFPSDYCEIDFQASYLLPYLDGI